jgi:hypothetical protein
MILSLGKNVARSEKWAAFFLVRKCPKRVTNNR